MKKGQHLPARVRERARALVADPSRFGDTGSVEIVDEDHSKQTTTLRIDRILLAKIDQQARKRGISRTAYILIATGRAVEQGF